MGKTVYSNDFLHFSSLINKALIENNNELISKDDLIILLGENKLADNFIHTTFSNVFYTESDLYFLDQLSSNIKKLNSSNKRALAYTALFRACLKKQPRGVFTISGDLSRYDDGRRDLKISIREHFLEQIDLYNEVVFDNGKQNHSFNTDVFDFNYNLYKPDLVYLDPPYVPESNDNCYIKRYHFLEGLSKYWSGEEIMEETKVKKIKKKYTPFSYKKSAIEAFDQMFEKFSDSIIVLSYSSNSFPDLDTLVSIMKNHKKTIDIKTKAHRYSFGNHSNAKKSEANEYLIIGQS
jgi:DNA adenine methylase/adenine-specific DNA-methyltransferase